jgi:hypothetical protein
MPTHLGKLAQLAMESGAIEPVVAFFQGPSVLLVRLVELGG